MKLPKSYYDFFDICKMEDVNINTAKSATSRGLEGIAAMESLKPIGHLFKEFEKPVKGGMRKQYGIKRTYYDYYKKHGEPPKISTGRPPKPGHVILKGAVPKDLKEKFYKVVDKANSMSVVHVTYADMIAVAIDEFIQRRPQFLEQDEE